MTDIEYFFAIIIIAMPLTVAIYNVVAERKLHRDLETDKQMRAGFSELKRQGRL